jgi:hypothetical protein
MSKDNTEGLNFWHLSKKKMHKIPLAGTEAELKAEVQDMY